MVEGAEMDLSMEEWEEKANNMDFEEWLVQEIMEIYSPQLVTEISCTPSELEGRGENNDKDIGDTVHLNTQIVHIKSVHTV